MKKNLLLIAFLSVISFSLFAQGGTTILDDTDAGWTWTGFAEDPKPECYGGNQHVAEVSGSTAEFSFTGTNIDFYGETWIGGPSLEIFIDGVSKGTFSQSIAPEGLKNLFATITGLDNINHTVKLVSIGEWAAIDYVDFTPPAIVILDDTDAGWTWTGFAEDPKPECYGGNQHVAELTGSTAEFEFTGRSIKFYGETWIGGPSLEIFIDGVSKGTFSQSIAPEGLQILFATITGLDNINHTVKLVSIGEWAALDYVEYSSELIVVEPDFTVTVSGESPQWEEGKDKLTDGILTNQWGIDGTTAWIQFEYSTPQVNNMYSLTSATKEPTRDFKDWTVEGSNDGTTWDVLDTQTNHAPWAARSSTVDFYFTNTVAYTYYKINVTALNGGTYAQLGEIAFGNGTPILPLVVTVSGDNAGEGPDKLVDGDLNTKWSVETNTAWIQFAYSEAKRWNKYSLTSGNDDPTRDFKNWTLQGSTDGTAWTTLDTQTNHAPWATRNSTLDFEFSNLSAYKFYKFDVTANNGNVGATQLSEIAFSFFLPEEALIYTTTGSAASYITYNNWNSLQADSLTLIEKTLNPIIVDGDAEAAWSEANSYVIKKAVNEKKLGEVLDLNLYPQSETDLYATVKTLWNDNGVYMFFDVKDDFVRYQNYDYQWENDGIEFYFSKAIGDAKIQIIIPAMVGTPHPSKPAALAFESGAGVGSDPAYKVFGFDNDNWDASLFNWAMKKTADGYSLEVYMDRDIVTNNNSLTNYGLDKMFCGDFNVDEADEKQNTNVPALFVRESTLGLMSNSNQEYASSNNYGYFKLVDAINVGLSEPKAAVTHIIYDSRNKQILVRSSDVYSVAVYNSVGQIMGNNRNNSTISTSNFVRGMYFVKAIDATGKVLSIKKIVVN
ncbi:MAG: discoidin domain-containing protein [Bacteroidales bacterium]|nr:discoidin domain-containing protein [Bacteroidales bacterium]